MWEWVNLGLRWFHLIAGISWIGSSFYFMWLDSHLVDDELWMVHSGGFYRVEKKKIAPGQMPKVLHWFKWEATLTWVSGFFLLGVVYYLSGGIYLVDPAVFQISVPSAIAISLGMILLSWFAYDRIWISSMARKGNAVPAALSLVLLLGVIYTLCHLFSGRAAYLHTGVILGTLMVLNVWVRILPAQQQMIDATQEGKQPDFTLGTQAKRRSVHNSYMTLPVIFIMLSNHYPSTYGHALNWVVLALFIAVGAGIRHFMITRAHGQPKPWVLAPVSFALLILFTLTQKPRDPISPVGSGKSVPLAKAHSIIQQRCITCHSTQPTDDVFRVAPNGITFDSPERIKILAERIKFRAVISKTMPLGNKTQMTQEERDTLGKWADQL